MKWQRPIPSLTLGLLGGLALGCGASNPPATSNSSTTEPSTSVTAQRPVTKERATSTPETVQRDNTGVNVRDRDSTAKTPFDQNENKADIKITADIRKRVVAEKMSVDAHNVKIMTQDGKVTLRGPVASQDEKTEIEKIAHDVAGADRVDNQLEITNP